MKNKKKEVERRDSNGDKGGGRWAVKGGWGIAGAASILHAPRRLHPTPGPDQIFSAGGRRQPSVVIQCRSATCREARVHGSPPTP